MGKSPPDLPGSSISYKSHCIINIVGGISVLMALVIVLTYLISLCW